MTTVSPTVVGIDVNPSNTAQRYVLWSNGYIQSIGGAPAITSGPNWFGRIDQPVGVAMHITNWSNGQGYVLDYTGNFNPLNGAPVMGVNGYVTGVPQATSRTYVDWAWDPAGTGKGAVLDHWGQLYPFGGLTGLSRTGRRWSHPIAKRCRMQFTPDVRCITLDMYGGLHGDWNAVVGTGGPNWAGWDAARDFVVVDWVNGRGYVLDLYGGHTQFGGALVIFGYPYKQGVDCGRRHHCLDITKLTFWVVWDGGQQYEFTAAESPTVAAGGGTDEQQTVTVTGSPTGGTFTLTYGGQTTSAIAWNATWSDVQVALAALSSIGANNVAVSGVPGGPWTVEFTGTLGSQNLAAMTKTSSLTGGTSPNVTIATLTDGSGQLSPAGTVTTTTRPTLTWTYGDPEGKSQIQWQLYVFTQAFASAHTMTDPSAWASSAVAYATGYQPSQRGVVLAYDFSNINYVFYVRVQNKLGLWSVWSPCAWAQNVPLPPHPTGLTATADNVNFRVALTCTCTVDGTADLVVFEYSDDSGVTWNEVRGAEAVPIATAITTYDYDVPLGVTRQYRTFVYKASPRYISTLSNVASASVTNLKYALTSVADPTLGGEVFPIDTPSFDRDSVAGVFAGVGAEYPTVVSDGTPKARTESLGVECDRREQWELVDALVTSNSTLCYRDPFGDVTYCRVVGKITRTQQWFRPYPDEVTPLRHNHKVVIPLQEVTPPLVLDIGYTIPPGPVQPQ